MRIINLLFILFIVVSACERPVYCLQLNKMSKSPNIPITTNTVNLNDSLQVLVMSCFTPNGDGINEVLEIQFYNSKSKASFNFQAISLTICDKCRTVLHNNDRPNWDGRDDDGIPCPEGVYKGTIEIILQDLSAVGANFEFELRK